MHVFRMSLAEKEVAYRMYHPRSKNAGKGDRVDGRERFPTKL